MSQANKVKLLGMATMDAFDDRLEKVREFITHLPYCKALRLGLERLEPGRAVLTLPYDSELVGDPATGVVHGGAVSALMDTACGAAVMGHPSANYGAATLDLRIDYMRAATPGQTVIATADCYHVTRSVAFVRATAVDDDSDRPVASASGAFTFAQSTAASE